MAVETGPVPRASIGLPVHNGMPLLEHSLASVLAQDEEQIEVVVSDNASDDGTEAYCRAVARRDPRLRYVRNESNVGAAANFQMALALARAPYFAWAAHDDTYAPAFVTTCLARLAERPDAAACVPAHRRVDEDGTLVSVRQEPPALGSHDLATRLRAHLWRRGWLTIYGLWRTELLRQAGPPPPVWGSDVVLLWRALLLAPIVTVPDALNDYAVSRRKTADSVQLVITAVRSEPHFPNARMLRDLRRAADGLTLPPADRATAEHVLRRWVLTRHYRELVATDFLIESRRARAGGARLRSAACVVPAALLGPRMALRGARLAWSSRTRPPGGGTAASAGGDE